MVALKMNNENSPLNFTQNFSLSTLASYHIHKNNIASIYELMQFIRVTSNCQKLPPPVLHEYLSLIEQWDPVFVASFRSINKDPELLKVSTIDKSPISELNLDKGLLDSLYTLEINYIEDFSSNLDITIKGLTNDQLFEIQSGITDLNDFLAKEALLLSIPIENSTSIEEIDLRLVSGVISRNNVSTLGELVKTYPFLYNNKNMQDLGKYAKQYIVDQVFEWYSKDHNVDLIQEFSEALIENPFSEYFLQSQVSLVQSDSLSDNRKTRIEAQLNQLACNEVSIDYLQLSSRVENSLKRNGIYSIRDLKSFSGEITDLPGIGEDTAIEIQEAIGLYNPQKIVHRQSNSGLSDITLFNTDKTPVSVTDLAETNKSTIDSMSIKVLGLSAYSNNMLARSGITTLQKLIRFQGSLTKINGIGISTENEILEKLSSFLTKTNSENDDNPEPNKLSQILQKDVCDSFFSEKTVKKLRHHNMFILGDVVNFMADNTTTIPSIKRLSSEISTVLSNEGTSLTEALLFLKTNPQYSTDATSTTKNTYISGAMGNNKQTFAGCIKSWFSILSKREKKILAAYYGFMSGENHTLEQVAKDEGVTRERIRQIKSQAMAKLRNYLALNRIDIMGPIIYQINLQKGLISTNQLSQYYKGELLVDNIYSDNFFIFLRDFIDRYGEYPLYYCRELDAWVTNSNDIDYVLLISQKTQELLLDNERLLWEELYTKLLSYDGLLTLDSGFALAVINSLKEIGIIEYSLNGFWSLPIKKDRLYYFETALRSVGHPIHYSEIAEIASRTAKKYFSERSANAVLNSNNNVFTRVGQGIYGLVEWGLHKDGSLANAARRILHEAGCPLPMKLLVSEILSEWQAEEISILSAITNDRRFEKLPDGRISLTEFGLMHKKYQKRRDETKKDRLFLILQELGEPTYYKEISTKHNERFPTQVLTNQRVYQTLMTNNELFLKTGAATFGLIEWGITNFETKKNTTRKEQLINAFNSVNHPMDYTELKETVDKLYPDHPISKSSIYQVVGKNPDIFFRIKTGVYSLTKWHQS